MALTIYPNTDFNSYVSLTEANELITKRLTTSSWSTLTDPEKEILLMQSSLLISMSITDPLLNETPINIKLATIYLSDYSIGKNMTDFDPSAMNLKRIRIEGALEKEYFARNRPSNSFPEIVNRLLTPYGLSSNTVKLFRS